jgi:PAS domain-containing protein
LARRLADGVDALEPSGVLSDTARPEPKRGFARSRGGRLGLSSVEHRQHKNLVLILAREFASKLATPVFLTDEAGTLVYLNEAAERMAGRSFAEIGEVPAEEWSEFFQIRELDGTPIPLERLPGGIALLERRPAHHTLAITGVDGRRRELSVTAFPLLAHRDELVGVVGIYWEADGGAG